MEITEEKLEAVALMKTVFLSVFCLASSDCRSSRLYYNNSIYSTFSVEIVFMVMKKWREKNALRKPMATEILNNVAILSA